MYKSKRIGIIIPALNEEAFIVPTVLGLPHFIDEIVVIDDGSTDKTAANVKSLRSKKILLLRNNSNRGLGFSIKCGFHHFLKKNSVDVVCITAGDNQFDGSCLTPMIASVISRQSDYAKSNRFLDRRSLGKMPTHRLIGNIIFTLITKFASGYYSIFDTLNAFSATRIETLRDMNLDEIESRYDFEISYLMQFAYLNARVKDYYTPIKYGDEVSDIKYPSFIVRAIRVLVIGFFRRINRNYVIYNFHPIALFFYTGWLLVLFGFFFGLWVIINAIGPAIPSTATVMASIVPFIVGIQLLLQAIVLDIQNEPK